MGIARQTRAPGRLAALPSPLAWTVSLLAHACVGVACYLVPAGVLHEPPRPQTVRSAALAVSLVTPSAPAQLCESAPREPAPPELEVPEIEAPEAPRLPPQKQPEVPIREPEAPPPLEDWARREPLRAPRLKLGRVAAVADPPPPEEALREPPAEPTPREAAPRQCSKEPPCEPEDRSAASEGRNQPQVVFPVPCAENPPPSYPRRARRRGQEGLVVVLVRVSREGTCLAAEVKQSSGHAVLDEAALAAVKRWRFQPARSEGEAVEAEVEVPIRFQLAD